MGIGGGGVGVGILGVLYCKLLPTNFYVCVLDSLPFLSLVLYLCWTREVFVA